MRPQPQPSSTPVRSVSSELLITVAGIVTSLATVAINAALTRTIDLNFLSVSHLFVIPTGALIGGMGAASGYYFAAVWTHTMPSRKFLFEMGTIGVSAWLLAIWLDYATLPLKNGVTASTLVSFWEYFKIQAESTSLRIGSGSGTSTGELGRLGYVREALQLLGFAAGGLLVWVNLSDRESCSDCRKYAKTKTLLDAEQPSRFQRVLETSDLDFPNMVEQAKQSIGNQGFVGLDLALAECPQCHRIWARPSVVVGKANNPTRLKLGAYRVTAEQAQALRLAVEQLPKETAKATS